MLWLSKACTHTLCRQVHDLIRGRGARRGRDCAPDGFATTAALASRDSRRRGRGGYAYASLHRARPAYRWSADCSIYLAGQEQGRGTGRLLYRRLFADLIDLGYVSAFAGVALPNEGSVGFHEAMGFLRVGTFNQAGFKHGNWLDVSWWQLQLRQPPNAPAEPRDWET